jgi:ABC-type multidrug transport system fused ATPase/permease subunit
MNIIKHIKSSNIFALKEFYIPYKRYFIAGILFIVLSSATFISLPYLFGKLIDVANNENEVADTMFNSLNTTAIIIFCVFLLNSLFQAIKNYLFSVFAEKSSVDIMDRIFKKLIRNPIKFYDLNLVGDLFSRVTTDVTAFRNIFSEQIASLLYQPFIIIFGLTILFLINVKLTLLLIAVLPVGIFFAVLFGERIRKLSRETFDLYAKSNTILEESLQLIRTIKIFNREFDEEKKYSSALDQIVRKSISVSVVRILLEALGSFILLISLILVIWYASVLVNTKAITVGELLEYIIYVGFLGTAFSNVANAYGAIQKTAGASEKIRELLNEKSELISSVPKNENLILGKSVKFTDVSFCYPTRCDTRVLDGFNMEIAKGEKIGIVGTSGGGKSTIVQLLLKLYDSDSGIIELDGIDINNIPLSNYRNMFGVVSQEIKLIAGTIRDNITYGYMDATEDEIINACNISNSSEFISNLPDGLESYIGDNGVTLSGGQRQRIAIARAIIKNPQILVFDEATSALDKNNEAIINSNLLQYLRDKTTIILSHRLSIISRMDKIYRIENGKLHELSKENLTELNIE